MKKQTKSNWRNIVFAAIAAVVFICVTNSLAFAQTGNYKVGDRAENMSAGKWVKVEIIEIKDDGYYVIRDLDSGISGALVQAKYLRSIKTDTPTNNQNNPDNQPQTGGGAVATPEKKLINERYGSREPRTCEDTKAPAKGAITAALAQKYLNCQMEKIWSGHLYLVENVKVEVGGGVPYDPTLGAFEAINVRVPLYPIRGSFLQYQCDDLIREHVGPPDTNCTTYSQPKATGYCYKTTFGDWKCNMADRSATEVENVRTKVAPPKP